jgi:hypothetical protein
MALWASHGALGKEIAMWYRRRGSRDPLTGGFGGWGLLDTIGLLVLLAIAFAAGFAVCYYFVPCR